MGAYSIANTEFLSHDYDARGLEPEYRVATRNGEPYHEWGLSFEYAKSVAEAMLAALPLVDWQGDRDYLRLGDKVFCCKEIDGMGTTSEIEVEVTWLELVGNVLAPVFHEHEHEHDEFHSPHQLLIEGWEFTLLAEDDNA